MHAYQFKQVQAISLRIYFSYLNKSISMLRTRSLFILLALALVLPLKAALQPGFDKQEYLEMLRIIATFSENPASTFPKPEHYTRIHRSPAFVMDNMYDFWYDPSQKAVAIHLRGTTGKAISWLENFYAAMIPAEGSVQLGNGQQFDYKFSSDKRAAVHVGWTVGLGYMVNDMKTRLDSVLNSGVRDLVVVGHSQGGALAFLMTAYLRQAQLDGKIPADTRIKTYCSAGPKPGNLYFAYDYERQTQNGWAFNVINAADWVPETPISIQTLNDFNTTNPFKNAKKLFKKQKFPQNILFKYFFNQLEKPTTKARKKYEKFLGKLVGGFVEKQVEGAVPPPFFHSNNYVRTGHTIVLYPDAEYFTQFPESDTNFFVHHMFAPYYHLAQKLTM